MSFLLYLLLLVFELETIKEKKEWLGQAKDFLESNGYQGSHVTHSLKACKTDLSQNDEFLERLLLTLISTLNNNW